MHIGRLPGLPESVWEHLDGGPTELSVRPVWEETVARARELRVAAVLLAGDVVDSDDGFLAAYAPLASGVRELVDAGIAVIAVSGNHDTEVLPRLAREIPELRLLGAGGEWDSEVVAVGGQPALRVLGWSFPAKQVKSDPMDSMPPAFRAGDFGDGLDLPVVGLLHGDLDVTGSHYAPVSPVLLESFDSAAWLLGHQHKPSDLRAERPIGYLGCLSGNDFGETGVRGPWLGTLAGGRLSMEQLPLSRLRLEEVELDLSGVTTRQEVEERLTKVVREVDELRLEQECRADVVLLRPTLVGRSTLPRVERGRAIEAAREAGALFSTREGTKYFLDQKSHDLVRPEYDLYKLGCGTDPPAVLAQLIVGLEECSEDYEPLVQRTLQRARNEAEHKNFAGLEPRVFESQDARRYLIEGGLRALEDLMAQKPEAGSEVLA